MRLDGEVTTIGINPVAWLILTCTLEDRQKLAGQHRPLPDFALQSPKFMEAFFKRLVAATTCLVVSIDASGSGEQPCPGGLAIFASRTVSIVGAVSGDRAWQL